MMLLRLHIGDLGERVRGLPHLIRESWPLNRVPRSRDWELLIVGYLVLVVLSMATVFIFMARSTAP